ncbi:MAG: HAMP domain-containing histidine kinase, partial [Sedimentisphaerales bacterium]|nr:HAMP domain-containing histidine kinase [Sedimentisphaerales bacterium]
RSGYLLDGSGRSFWPPEDKTQDAPDTQAADIADNPIFKQARQLEFVQKDYAAAQSEYSKLSELDDALRHAAVIGKVRCLRKAGQLAQAIDICSKEISHLATEPGSMQDLWQMKLLLAEMYAQAGRSELTGAINDLLTIASEPVDHSLKVFVLEKAVDIAQQSVNKESISTIEAELDYARLLLDFQEKYLPSVPSTEVRRLTGFAGDDYFGFFATGKDANSCYCLISAKQLTDYLQARAVKCSDEMVFANVYGVDLSIGEEVKPYSDSLGRMRVPEMIFSLPLSLPFDKNFTLYLAFRPGIFASAALLYQQTYLWWAALILLAVMGGGLLAGRILLGQMRVNRLKNDFIATVTHELKTPLASTRMLIDTLREGRYSDQTTLKDYLEIISGENQRLTSLIDNFLSFSRMERGKNVFDCQEISVNELITETQRAFNHKSEKNLILSVTFCSPDATIYADKQAMLPVLLYLFNNAYKYSSDLSKEIGLRGEHKAGIVRLVVKDNGVGLTLAQKRRVFDRFWRADNSLTRQTEGTGLGLAIVKYILDAHGFAIKIDSKPGIGSEFTVETHDYASQNRKPG